MWKIKIFAPACGLNNIDITLNHKIKILIANKEKTFLREHEFLIVPKITEISPIAKIVIEKFEMPKYVNLADENFNVPQKIDLLLGTECFFDLLKMGHICCSSQDVILKETVFGFVISEVTHNFSVEKLYCYP